MSRNAYVPSKAFRAFNGIAGATSNEFPNMTPTIKPVDQIRLGSKEGNGPQHRPIYGGYANARGLISLFADGRAYRVNLKARVVQERPLLNLGAQRRYDAAQPGEAFEYCGVNFRRLTHAEIVEICTSGSFRVGFRSV